MKSKVNETGSSEREEKQKGKHPKPGVASTGNDGVEFCTCKTCSPLLKHLKCIKDWEDGESDSEDSSCSTYTLCKRQRDISSSERMNNEPKVKKKKTVCSNCHNTTSSTSNNMPRSGADVFNERRKSTILICDQTTQTIDLPLKCDHKSQTATRNTKLGIPSFIGTTTMEIETKMAPSYQQDDEVVTLEISEVTTCEYDDPNKLTPQWTTYCPYTPMKEEKWRWWPFKTSNRTNNKATLPVCFYCHKGMCQCCPFARKY